MWRQRQQHACGGLWLFLCVLLFPSSALAQSSSDMSINAPFQDSFNRLTHAACVTLFHRKGRLGCGTEDRSLHVGKLVYYKGNSNGNNNFPSVNEDFVAVVEEYHLDASTLNTLVQGNSNGYLKGLLFLNSTGIDYNRDKSYYSPAAQSPRGYGTPSAYEWYGNNAYPWNAKGQGLNIYDFYGLPMAYVPDSDVSNELRNAAMNQINKNNNNNNNEEQQEGSSSIVAEFNYYMGPDGINSLECLGWKDQADGKWSPKCLPLGGTSVWATAGSPEPNQDNQNNNNNDDINDDDARRELNNNNNNNNYYYDANNRPVVLVAAGMDASSLFHDLVPGANSAASNILALLMAAKMVGGLGDNVLDKLTYRIAFGFFQGETYGFAGSRSFLRDVAFPGFQCSANDRIVRSVANNDKSEKACLYPLRHSLEFQRLGPIAGMLAVDQVGLPVADGLLYVHNDGQGDGSFGSFMSNVLKYSYTSNFAVSYTSIEDNDNGWPFPPSPLQSLVQLSQGAAGGAVLTGYDYAFTNQVPFHSHLESNQEKQMDLDAIAAAATLLARAALAAAYDGGQYDYETSSQYASQWIGELSSSDETLNILANCLFKDGNCDYLKKYNSMERENDKARTGFSYGSGYPLGTPPNYYVGVYNINYGQPFVQVGDSVYGAYDGDKYGNRGADAFGIQPTLLESAIRGMLNDFLGRGSNLNGGSAQECSKPSDCDNVQYCQKNDDHAVCTGGGKCVCARSHFHLALDEALEAKPGMGTGYFVQSENDNEISAVYTEPYWSNDVGVRVYRDVGQIPGVVTLGVGAVVSGLCVLAAFVLKVGLKKEKMY
ncbi:Nicastrin [Seminavis robusta]|uniref:Nicastrin n=1 Tax=Seminavis robusta TaxID=568900 RepID=A0A9N8HXL4_9STRA|nr:Nicastrin [Seminavis robusta]|eukprot:Sro1828_g300210.1 Nicastrin (825) ;mRNA; r:11980-14454